MVYIKKIKKHVIFSEKKYCKKNFHHVKLNIRVSQTCDRLKYFVIYAKYRELSIMPFVMRERF